MTKTKKIIMSVCLTLVCFLAVLTPFNAVKMAKADTVITTENKNISFQFNMPVEFYNSTNYRTYRVPSMVDCNMTIYKSGSIYQGSFDLTYYSFDTSSEPIEIAFTSSSSQAFKMPYITNTFAKDVLNTGINLTISSIEYEDIYQNLRLYDVESLDILARSGYSSFNLVINFAENGVIVNSNTITFTFLQFGTVYNNYYTTVPRQHIDILYTSIFDNEAYKVGFKDGGKEQYGEGYREGYRVASSQNNTFLTFFTSIADSQWTIFKSIFNFDILGVNLFEFIQAVLVFYISVKIVMLIRGGGA